MDLGIAGRKALVCAASKGLGRGCALALAQNGVEVTITARTASALEQAAQEIAAATGAKVTPVAGDITTPAGRAAALAACPEPDILVNNAGGPPPGDFREWDENDWLQACNANMITAIMLIRAVVDGMIGAQVRPHRQHHLELGQGADPAARPVQRRALGPDRLRRRPRPPDRGAQRHDQQHPAGPLRHRPAALGPRLPGAEVGSAGRPRSRPNPRPRCRPAGSVTRTSSARSAPSSAAARRATSPARTS